MNLGVQRQPAPRRFRRRCPAPGPAPSLRARRGRGGQQRHAAVHRPPARVRVRSSRRKAEAPSPTRTRSPRPISHGTVGWPLRRSRPSMQGRSIHAPSGRRQAFDGARRTKQRPGPARTSRQVPPIAASETRATASPPLSGITHAIGAADRRRTPHSPARKAGDRPLRVGQPV